MIRSAAAVAVAVCLATAPAAQQPPSGVPAPANAGIIAASDLQPVTNATRLRDAEALMRSDDAAALARAEALLDEVVVAARASDTWGEQGYALNLLTTLAIQRADYVKARAFGLDALAVFGAHNHQDGLARAHYNLAITANYVGNHSEARDRASAALAGFEAAGNRRGRARASLLIERVSDMSSAERIRLIEGALEDARASGDRSFEAEVLHQLGDQHFSDGDFEPALLRLEQAASAFESLNDLISLGTVYNSIGRVYRANRMYPASLEAQRKALTLHERAKQPFTLMQSLNAVASAYSALNRLDRALGYQERAVTVAEQSGSPRFRDFVNANLANILIWRGEYQRGAAILEDILSRDLDLYRSQRYAMLSAAYRRLGRLDEALAAADKAVETCQSDSTACIAAWHLRAETLAVRGDVARASADVQRALDAIDAQRAKLLPSDFVKQEYSASQQSVYSVAIGLQLRLQQPRTALRITERARARAFIDLLASRNMLREGETSRDARVATSALPGLASPVAASVDDVDLLATAARLQSTLLVYWVADAEVFVWTVSPTGAVHAATVAVPAAKLRALVQATSPYGEDDDPSPPKQTLTTRGSQPLGVAGAPAPAFRELYDLLIKPVRDTLPTTSGAAVTIVPHGPLSGLAFAALRNERGRYLLEDYTLHYVPAASVLDYTRAQRRPKARVGAMLMVADAKTAARSRLEPALPPLPGARLEARAVSALLPATRITQLVGSDATESRVRASMAGKSVIHVATHAILHDADPFTSYLAVGADAAGGDDGRLTAQEIYGLSLAADLVVLSACQSGSGIAPADSIAAFARAFIHAGAPSLVVSVWDVADDSAASLLATFYRGWLGGESKARALRAAQLDLLRRLRAGQVRVDTPLGRVALPEHPVFWAGFSLVGEPD